MKSKKDWIQKVSKHRSTILGVIFCGAMVQTLQAQRIALKTNALYWATLSPNIGVEFRLSQHFTFGLNVEGNAITIGSYKPNFFAVDGEIRYWFSRPMARHFVGLMALMDSHDMQLKNTYHYGDAFGGGLTYGYAMPIGKRWNIEGAIGLGIVSLRDYKWEVGEAKPAAANNSKSVMLPLKLSLSISYIFK